MKLVDVINYATLNSPIGPTGTIRRITKNRNYFIERGYDITVFSSDLLSNQKKRILNINSPFSNKKSLKKKSIKFLTSLVPQSFLLSALYEYRNYLKIKKLTRYYFKEKRQTDIVVFHGYIECFQFLKKNKDKDIKTVIFLHSDGMPFEMNLIYRPRLKNTWYERWLMSIHKYVIENVNQCVFISKIGQGNFLAENPAYKINKTSLILNGIEDYTDAESIFLKSFIKNVNNKYKLVCSGTLINRKGQSIIIEALNKINKNVLKIIHLTLIGDGAERNRLEYYVTHNGLTENVIFLGKIDNSEVFKYLAENDIFILMSLNEGLPISIIEAMRSSLPIITTKRSGMPELVKEGFNGFLLDPDVDQLVVLLNKITEYDWKTMGRNSRSRFETEFTFNRMQEEYCNMLDSL
ncbi:MAG: hypothetical protein A2X18_05445 [Bacteroidetes bacterium GWF2_40_14]|nr:MAG: hypothetical protein A2X18_05445 [Bacteroidetes bacterium GWF2_40_14]